MRALVIVALTASSVASAAPVRHPTVIEMPAVVHPGMTIAELVAVHPGLTPQAVVADPDDPTIRRWDRREVVHAIDGVWSFEFDNGRLAGYVFQPDASIEDADHREVWTADHSCQMGFGRDQFAACVKAADGLIAELSRRYGKPAITRGVTRRDDPRADRFVVAEPSCARAVNVVTATWGTANARFRVMFWQTESMDASEYVWAFVEIGPHEQFADARVKPVC